MDMQEIRAKSEGDLRSELSELLQEQFNLRMQKGMGQLTQTHQMKRVRRDIARVRTVLREMSNSASAAKEGAKKEGSEA